MNSSRRILLLYEDKRTGRRDGLRSAGAPLPSSPSFLRWNGFGSRLYGELVGVLSASPHAWDVLHQVDAAWIEDGLSRGEWDGVISNFSPRTEKETRFWNEMRKRTPWVSVGSGAEDARSNRVALGEQRAMDLLVGHLFHLGHRRIGWASLTPPGPRYAAWRQAMEERGLAVRRNLVFQPSLTELPRLSPAQRGERLERFLREARGGEGNRLEALVGFNDIVARNALEMLLSDGVKVPGETAVVGVDGRDDPPGAPRLTTLRYEPRPVALRALRLLEEIMEGRRRREGQSSPIQGRLRIGDTTGRPPPRRVATLRDFRSDVESLADEHLVERDPCGRFAEALGVGRIHFKRKFAEAFGTSAANWIAAKRVERARDLVTSTDLPIYRIARECGYESDATFHRHFQARFRLTPTELRDED